MDWAEKTATLLKITLNKTQYSSDELDIEQGGEKQSGLLSLFSFSVLGFESLPQNKTKKGSHGNQNNS